MSCALERIASEIDDASPPSEACTSVASFLSSVLIGRRGGERALDVGRVLLQRVLAVVEAVGERALDFGGILLQSPR